MNQQQLEQLVRTVVQELAGGTVAGTKPPCPAKSGCADLCVEVPDISAIPLQETLLVENPANREMYMEMKRSSPARIGVGRAGPRQNTATLLRFRADHAAAMDTVQTDVPEHTIQELGLLAVQSAAPDKAEYLMNPNIGRVFDEQTAEKIRQSCPSGPDVQIVVSDGLSSVAVENNLRDILPSLLQGLKGYGLRVGTNLFVRFGRVGIMDAVSDLLKPQVTILLIGERPGLVTNESLSCYMTYKGYSGMAESARTVISNIYRNGTPPTEAGAHIASVAKKMIEQKAGGLELKL